MHKPMLQDLNSIHVLMRLLKCNKNQVAQKKKILNWPDWN